MAALVVMVSKFPAAKDSRLFQIPRAVTLLSLTDSMARKHLKIHWLYLTDKTVLLFTISRGLGLGFPALGSFAVYTGIGYMVIPVCVELYTCFSSKLIQSGCCILCPSFSLVFNFLMGILVCCH